MSKKIGVFTGSRGEWGYLRPVLESLKSKNIDFKILVANMHLLPEKGFTYKEIEKDGFNIDEKIYMNLAGPDDISWPKSLGLLMLQLPDILCKLEIDILLLAGDRAETFIAASVAYYSDIPIAHIQAGELSGHKDGMVRHSIGKLAHIHFASNDDAADRLRRFGEQEFRINNVGAPQLDDIVNQDLFSLDELNDTLKAEIQEDYALCIVHPTSENPEDCIKYVNWISDSLNSLKIQQIWIYPNNDAGSVGIINSIEKKVNNPNLGFRSLNRKIYLSLLKHSSFIIGNSSSGILEAPSLKTPTINLGIRQKARIAAISVVTIENPQEADIIKSVSKLSDKEMRDNLKKVENPYGDGNSSKRITNIIENIELDMNVRNKFIEESS